MKRGAKPLLNVPVSGVLTSQSRPSSGQGGDELFHKVEGRIMNAVGHLDAEEVHIKLHDVPHGCAVLPEARTKGGRLTFNG